MSDHVSDADPHTQYLKESEYEAHRSREDLLKQATLSLDFANNKYEVYEGPVNSLTQMPFNTALDFTRASSATARTATGNIQGVLTDEQRLVGNREGLLIEEQRTNLLTYSEDFIDSAWTKRNSVVELVSAQDAHKITIDTTVGGQGYGVVQGSVFPSSPTGNYYAISCIVKAGNIDRLKISLQANGYQPYITVNLSSKTFSAVDDSTYPMVVTFADAGSGFIKISVTFKYSDGQYSVGRKDNVFIAANSSVDGDYFYLRNVQAEEGSPSSYIPTAGSQVTRAADDCVRVLGDEFNPSEYTIFCKAASDAKNILVNQTLFDSNESVHKLHCQFNGSGINILSTGNGNSVYADIGSFDPEDELIVAVSMSKSEGLLRASFRGNYSEYPIINTEIDIIYLGRRSNNSEFSIDNRYKCFQVLPRALTEAELVALTTPDEV
jgi:hypothetical protein